MLITMTEFYMNLPDNKCSKCGMEFKEQHECYVNTCNECLEILNPKSNKKPEEVIKSRYRLHQKNGMFILQKLA
ncbi:protein YhfH [Neobacillus sp. PS3-12]|uniref:protein YhfH n=1 Tax=Neobacillus sp. PS3-12 TaxID=3070677 RepID=UPI0035A91B7E